MAQSLYEIIGGEPAVQAAVEIFYRKALADPRISRFFTGVDMEQLIIKQKAFLTLVLGGPHKYTGRDMRTAHADVLKKGLNDAHVEAVVEHLTSALKELGVKDREISKITAILIAIATSVRGGKT